MDNTSNKVRIVAGCVIDSDATIELGYLNDTNYKVISLYTNIAESYVRVVYKKYGAINAIEIPLQDAQRMGLINFNLETLLPILN